MPIRIKKTKLSDPAWLAEMVKGPGLFIPIQTATPGNGSHTNYFAAARKVKAQRESVTKALHAARYVPPSFPLRVTLTRYGWKTMDLTNVHSALKGAIDAIAEYCGVDDGDKARWDWVPKTATGRGYGVRIEIERQ